MAGPLEGIRVLDWTMWQFGPVAGAMLGDLGADVIKIEERVGGDPARGMVRLLDYLEVRLPAGRNWYFETNNRNKRSLTVDLKKQKGREIIYKLVERSDVFLQNFRKGVAERLGIDYETLSKINPRLIYACGSGYGLAGPEAHKPAFDFSGQARSGLMWIFGQPGDPPLPGTAGVSDQMGATMLAYGVLAALVARERTGEGQLIDVCHLSATMWLIGLSIGSHLLLRKGWPRYDRTHAGNPLWNWYQCKDGKWLILCMVQSQRYWADLCRVMGLEELIDDPRFNDAEPRRQNCVELIKILDRAFATRTRAEWEKALTEGGDFVYQAVQDLEDLEHDPQVIANKYIVDFDHPALGPVKMLNCPVAFSKTPAGIFRSAPEFGENTEEILLELGYSWEDIVQLKDEEVI